MIFRFEKLPDSLCYIYLACYWCTSLLLYLENTTVLISVVSCSFFIFIRHTLKSLKILSGIKPVCVARKVGDRCWGHQMLLLCTSICIFRWTLKWDSKVRKIASESSKTSGTEETPFLDNATHRYCLMALANISWARNTGPAPCSKESSSCRETTLERNSWDLEERRIRKK